MRLISACLFCTLTCLIFLTLTLSPLPALATPGCGGEPGWAAVELSGSVESPDAFRYDAQSLVFALTPTPHGWRVQMFDADDRELPTFAAPMRPVETNPLNIAGWHFRNLDNSGPNTGDVNAPQHQRRFTFGTLATDPQQNPELLTPGTPAEGLGGLAELVISGFTLTPPERGARAAYISLDFSICLIWQGGSEPLDPLVAAEPGIAFAAVVSTVIDCGFDPALFELSNRMAQGREGGQEPFLEPDMDGDGSADLVVPVTRRSDQAPGLAICLQGHETLVIAGYDGRIGQHLDPVYFERADFWAVHSGPVQQGVAEGGPPDLIGEAILLGKEDTSSVLFYLDAALSPTSYWQGD